MRKFIISYPDDDGYDREEVLSEFEIIRDYFPYWYSKMCEKFGKDHVNANYSWNDCLDDWIAVNWAEELE